MPRVNALGRLSCGARWSQPGWKPEMRTSVRATERVFLTQLPKETAMDSESGLDWVKGQCFANDAMARSRPRSLLPAFRNARGFCRSQEDQMASQPFLGK